MIFNVNYRLEDFVLNQRWDTIPKHIQERAIMCGIDLFNALILGSKGKQYAVGKKVAQSHLQGGDIPILADDIKLNLLGASVAFSHAANSFDIDDGYNMTKGHPGASFIGGALAAALDKNVTYREFLTTLYVCYEVAMRWGLAMQRTYTSNFHSSGAYGAFGTTVAIGRLLGLSKEQLNNALSIADYHAPMTPCMRSVEYPSMNKDGIPFGSLVGTMAVIETLCGETGKGNLLEFPEFVEYLDSLGAHYYIMDLYFKPYTCCRWAHQPIIAIKNMRQERAFSYKDIKKVRINTFVAAARLSKIEPQDAEEAQYNIAYPIAATLVHGDMGFLQLTDEAIHDPVVLDMMKKLEFKVSDEFESQFPEKRFANVEILLNNGDQLVSKPYEAPGERDDPDVSLEWIREKFLRLTKPIIKEEEQSNILDALNFNLDISMRDLIGMINNAYKKDEKGE